MAGLLLFHTEVDIEENDMSCTFEEERDERDEREGIEYEKEEEIHKPAHTIKCALNDCLVCKRDIPACLNVRSPTWPAIIRVVLFTLQHESPEKRYFNLKHDIYPFIASHWKRLCPQKNILKWKKPMQDALSHGMSLFDSGKAVYGTGFWGLRLSADPWEVSEDDSFPPGPDVGEVESNNIVNFPLSSRKRRLDEDEGSGVDAPLEKCDFHSLQQLRDMAVQLDSKFKTLKANALQQEESYETMSDVFMQAVIRTQEDIEREVENARNMWESLVASE